jgi:hypothetical protein
MSNALDNEGNNGNIDKSPCDDILSAIPGKSENRAVTVTGPFKENMC